MEDHITDPVLVGRSRGAQKLPGSICIEENGQTLCVVSSRKITLSQNVHRIVHLDVHMVTDGSKLVLLCRNNLRLVFALDLPAGGAVASEFAGDDNGFAILLRLEGFFALVLDVNCNLGYAECVLCETKKNHAD